MGEPNTKLVKFSNINYDDAYYAIHYVASGVTYDEVRRASRVSVEFDLINGTGNAIITPMEPEKGTQKED